MNFGILLFVSFVAGVLAGIVTSRMVHVKSKRNLPTILVFIPFIFLFILSLFFSGSQTLNNIQYMFLLLAIGILCSWSYFDKKGNENDNS
jgi:hypothetical protein